MVEMYYLLPFGNFLFLQNHKNADPEGEKNTRRGGG